MLAEVVEDQAPWVRSVAHGPRLHWNAQPDGQEPIPYCGRLLLDIFSGKGTHHKLQEGGMVSAMQGSVLRSR